VFNLIRKEQLYLSAKKVDLYSQHMDCLGHIIDDNGIHTDTNKMQKLYEWWTPQNFNDVQRFLGLVQQYLAQFVPNVSAYTSVRLYSLTHLQWLCNMGWVPLNMAMWNIIYQLHVVDTEQTQLQSHFHWTQSWPDSSVVRAPSICPV
jgi:hypothetical protein